MARNLIWILGTTPILGLGILSPKALVLVLKFKARIAAYHIHNLIAAVCDLLCGCYCYLELVHIHDCDVWTIK